MARGYPDRSGLAAVEDPFAGILDRSSVAQALRDARASLARPTRPFTPASRSLFQQADTASASSSRPSSSYSLDQLKFVRDSFAPSGSSRESLGSTRSSLRSRSQRDCQSIPEFESLEEPELRLADVLELGELGVVIPEGKQGDHAAKRASSESKRSRQRAAASESEAAVLAGRFETSPDEEYEEGGEADDLALRMDLPEPGSDESASEDEVGPSLQGVADVGAEGQEDLPKPARPDCQREAVRPRRRAPKATSSGDKVLPSTRVLGEEWVVGLQQVVTELQALDAPNGSSAGKCVQLESQKLVPLADKVGSLVADLLQAQQRAHQGAPKLFRVALALMDQQKADSASLLRLARCTLELLKLEAVVEDVGERGASAAYLNVARALFKLSKDASLDGQFRQEGLVQLILALLSSSAPQCASTELRVFLVGVLKNISSSDDNQRFLVKQGALVTMQGLMRPASLTGSAAEGQLFIQIAALLRNLMAASKRHPQFVSLGLLDDLTRISAAYLTNEELQINISRVFSKLTVCENTCKAFSNVSGLISQILRCLAAHKGALSLVTRHAFVLGNLTAKEDCLREMLMFEGEDEGARIISGLLERYWQRDRKLAQLEASGSGKGTDAADCEGVLVKLVRLVANVTISPTVGTYLSSDPVVVDTLLDILGCKRMPESEELVLSATAAVTNLLFYDSPDNLLLTSDNKLLQCKLLRPMLLESYNVEALVEAARALGNLSRHQDARQWMVELRIDEVLSILLAHGDRDLVFYACGALVNLAADPDAGVRLCQGFKLRGKLAALLRDAPEEDEELMLVAVKVLSNLRLDPSSEESWPDDELSALREGLHRTCSTCENAPQPDQTEPEDAVDGQDNSTGVLQSREVLFDLASRLLSSLPTPEATES